MIALLVPVGVLIAAVVFDQPVDPVDPVLTDEEKARVVQAEFMQAARRAFQDITESGSREAMGGIDDVPGLETSVAMFYMMMDPSIPFAKKRPAISALFYFVSPFDAVPDAMPAGWADDLIVAGRAYWQVKDLVTDEHRSKAKAFIADLEAKRKKVFSSPGASVIEEEEPYRTFLEGKIFEITSPKEIHAAIGRGENFRVRLPAAMDALIPDPKDSSKNLTGLEVAALVVVTGLAVFGSLAAYAISKGYRVHRETDSTGSESWTFDPPWKDESKRKGLMTSNRNPDQQIYEHRKVKAVVLKIQHEFVDTGRAEQARNDGYGNVVVTTVDGSWPAGLPKLLDEVVIRIEKGGPFEKLPLIQSDVDDQGNPFDPSSRRQRAYDAARSLQDADSPSRLKRAEEAARRLVDADTSGDEGSESRYDIDIGPPVDENGDPVKFTYGGDPLR